MSAAPVPDPDDSAPLPAAAVPGVRPFRLAALVLLLALGAGAVVLGLSFERLMVRHLTAMTRGHAVDMAQAMRTMLGDDLDVLADPNAPGGDAALAGAWATVDAMAHVLPLVKVHLYAPDGTILMSTDPAARGKRRADNPRFQAAMNGTLISDFSDQRHFTLSDREVTSDAVIATYLPLRARRAGGPVVAVLEVYQDVAPAMAGIRDTARDLTLAIGAVMLMLYAALLLAARWLEGLMRRQHAALEREAAEHQEALVHLRRVQDAMETTILERTRRLRESEARFRDFAESSSDWLWEVDARMRYTYISDGFRRIVGLDPTALLGLRRSDVVELLAPEDHEVWQRHEDDLRAHRAFRDMRYTIRLPDGTRRAVIASGAPIIDERGRFGGYRGTTTDVTGREQAERTINRLGRIVDQSANEVYIFDAATLRFAQVNRGARRNLGLALEQLEAMTPIDIMPEESEASFLHRIDPLRRQPGLAVTFESLFRRSDGSDYPVEVRLQFMAHERPPVFVALVQDITERRQAERALMESEERYRATAEMTLDAILVHVDGAIVFANSQAVTVARAGSVDDLIGQPLTRYIHADYLGMTADRLRSLMATGRPSERAELVLLRHDGRPFDAEVSSTAIAFGGQQAVQTVIRDISESKAVQSQLIQTAKLATLGEMAAGMAHELSQPMNVIRMAAEGALLAGDHDGLEPEIERVLSLITLQAGRMGEIIDHMRIFSRKEAEAEEVFDPGLCVRQALNMVEAQFLAEDIAVIARYPDTVVAVRGRPVHLEQVLLNLLTNARDAIRGHQAAEGDGGRGNRITIDMLVGPGGAAEGGDDAAAVAATPLAAGAAQASAGRRSMLSIAIADTGGGIPADALDRVFEPFYTTKEVGTGTGLGLSVSFGLIAAMGGTITASNLPGEDGRPAGAVFRILLPLADPAQLHAPPGHRLPARPAPGRTAAAALAMEGDDDEPSALQVHVLVVDDEPFATKLVADHLGYLGYRVTTAGDGEEAYDKFLADPPDLVITDLRMPRSDGAELMARIHAHVPDLPVILVTGHLGHLEETSQALESEAVAIVKKPLSLARLAALVREHAGEPSAAPVG